MNGRSASRVLCKTSVVVLLLAAFSDTLVSAASTTICDQTHGVCVQTWQQDTNVPGVTAGYSYRTGENLSENTITVENFPTNFGQLCNVQLDGQVYAQPLVMTNVTIPQTLQNQSYTGPVAYVMTQNDKVYAIQATPPNSGTTCTILLEADLLQNNFVGQPTMSAVDCSQVGGRSYGCQHTIGPTIGVLGTPVISIDSGGTTGTLYVVAEMQSGTSPFFTYYHFLHALEITTLNEGSGNEKASAPVRICPGSCNTYGSTFSLNHIQRPGLLYVPHNVPNSDLTSDHIYVAFSMMDGAGTPYPNGMIFGFDATNLASTIGPFETSQGIKLSDGGGIWMGGAGLAFGSDGGSKNWIYVTTANGTFDESSNWGDSFIKLDPATLSIPSSSNSSYYFTPADEDWRGDDQNCNPPNGNDEDFGSGGVVLIPDGELAYPDYGYLAVSGDKEGYLWFMRRDQPGAFAGMLSGCNTGGTNNNVQAFSVGTNTIHNNIAFWESDSTSLPTKPYIYVSPQNSTNVYQFTVCAGSSDSSPICGSTYSAKGQIAGGSNGVYPSGLTPAISSASSTDPGAIVWAIDKTDGDWAESDLSSTTSKEVGVLYAFNAVTMAQLYASSNTTCAADATNQAIKFTVPTVANGYVYLGTQSSNNGTNNGKGVFYIFGSNRTCSP